MEGSQFYKSRGYRVDLNGEGKNKSTNWSLNDWNWDEHLCIATPVQQNCTAATVTAQLIPFREEIQVVEVLSNSSSSCSDEIIAVNGNGKGKRELEKRSRQVDSEDYDFNDESGNLTLKLGGHDYPITENDVVNYDEKNGKKIKISNGTASNRAVCQVDNCDVDLSNAKDYHRRHKICEMHSKSTKALVGNVWQRFCQQCSRFHVLQEFDEGKRSCRRRLAGHNKRRRKTHPEATVNGCSVDDDRSSNQLLISLIRILSNMHSNNSDQAKDQDLLSHLVRSLASYKSTTDGQHTSTIRQEYKVVNVEAPSGASSEARLVANVHETSRHLGSTSKINNIVDAQGSHIKTVDRNMNSAPKVSEKQIMVNSFSDGGLQNSPFPTKDGPQLIARTSGSTVGRPKFNNFDLNIVYSDSEDCGGLESLQHHVNVGTGSLGIPLWQQKDSHLSSPPQNSANSDSLSGQSPSSSGGDAQSRTDRIVFKLFGKDPNHFPNGGLRLQILNWLSHSPTDIESYIRPGCIILTVYLRLAESRWKELQDDLSSSLSRLLAISDDAFWRTGWVHIRVQHRIAFIYNGQIVVDAALPITGHNHSRIGSVTPIAVSVSEKVQFLVKGYNLSRPTARLLCALEGKYLPQEATSDMLDSEQKEIQCLVFPCSVPDITGRGFLEVEDHGLSGDFFPFIVAEKDVCLEIRTLESAVEASEFSDDSLVSFDKMGMKNQVLNFIHEMGWLLRRSSLRSRLSHTGPNSEIFPLTRFWWLMEFSMDHDWCAVVKKLLDVLFDGNVGSGEYSSVELAVLDMGLLHRAVRRRCQQMVELLLRYVPKQPVKKGSDRVLFRPDVVGPAGLTPLHIVASSDGSENLLDALTDDPGLVGVKAWKTLRDDAGSTPEDYAHLRGHYSYINLVQKKIKKRADTGHVVVDIPNVHAECNSDLKQNDNQQPTKFSGFQIAKTSVRPFGMQQSCIACDRQVACRNTSLSLVYRPTMLSMLAIAAVCVCVSLFFKTSPEVVYSFKWDFLKYGPI